jgi:RNA polymerase sigma-70 factor (ECF subfamily)
MRQQNFDRLYAEHAAPLLAFLDYRTGDRALAEDLLADTFERVLRARQRFDPRRGSEKAWLYTIALNLLRDHTRRVASGERALEQVAAGTHGHATAGHVEPIEQRDAVRRALRGLSPEEREVVALRYGADLSLVEIAKITGLKLSTVEGRIYRALRKLKERLE